MSSHRRRLLRLRAKQRGCAPIGWALGCATRGRRPNAQGVRMRPAGKAARRSQGGVHRARPAARNSCSAGRQRATGRHRTAAAALQLRLRLQRLMWWRWRRLRRRLHFGCNAAAMLLWPMPQGLRARSRRAPRPGGRRPQGPGAPSTRAPEGPSARTRGPQERPHGPQTSRHARPHNDQGGGEHLCASHRQSCGLLRSGAWWQWPWGDVLFVLSG